MGDEYAPTTTKAKTPLEAAVAMDDKARTLPEVAGADNGSGKNLPEPVGAAEGKVAVPLPQPPVEKPEENKASMMDSSSLQRTVESSAGRDARLALVENQKTMSLIEAWERSEMTKVETKAEKKMTAIHSWENSKKATLEADISKMEEKLEKKKAEYAEKQKNKIAMIHKEGVEKRAMVQVNRAEATLKIEEAATKYRACGVTPKKDHGCCIC
ncbi:remorin-like [Canna indica]|uniref:Remorin-like n=1 Tax=Canna indica TaxID=4628 RepID=A0AAQ3KS31_9LILI|nr:remorin-like [Canna indica]